MESQFELIAKTFQGLEEVLAQELTELGANDVQIGRRMVSFTGDKEMMYRANFCLRTAVRVLKPIKHFKAADADQVYDAVKSIEWSDYLSLDTSFSVDSVVYSQEFRHSKFVAYKVKDAIVDYFREHTGQRPNIRITNPDVKLNIHIAETDCTLSLDSSGESLHRRGYRTGTVDAPINEVLAAGILKLAGWDGSTDFVDPMCGSGTLIIEAALMARNIYPGVFRKEFAFEKWSDFDRELFDRIYNDDNEEREFSHKIYGYDINQPAVDTALANVKAAGVADCVIVERRPVQQFEQPSESTLMVTNPPYGERITSPDLLGLYRSLGERLKHQFIGNTAWVICNRAELFDQIGLKPSVRIPLFNGALDCELRKYQIFDGKYDDFRADGNDVRNEEDRRRSSEKRRFKQHRDEFRKRFDDEDDEDGIPGYMRRKHMEFERSRQDSRPRRDNDFRPRRSFDRDRRPDDREDRFGEHGRSSFGRDRKPFGGERRFGDRDGRPYRGDRDFRGGDRKSYQGDRRPFDRDRKPFDRNFKKKRYED